MVSLFGHDMYALIDLGATHSFISYQLEHQLQLPHDDMSDALCVRTPLGKNVIVKRESKKKYK